MQIGGKMHYLEQIFKKNITLTNKNILALLG
jgi:hypothetical protein